METLVLVVHVLLAAAIIALVLLQQGKGAEAGASFGGGASQTVFGSRGSGNFLSRVTAVMALGLFITSFVLAVFAKDHAQAVGEAGIPAAAAVQQSASASAAEPQAPAVKEKAPAAPAKSSGTDVPTAD